MNVDLEKVCEALYYLIDTKLYKELNVSLSQENILLLQQNINKTNQTLMEEFQSSECPSIKDDDNNVEFPIVVEKNCSKCDDDDNDDCDDDNDHKYNANAVSDVNNDGKDDADADSDDDNDGWTEKIDGKPDNLGNDTLILNENADIDNITTALKSFAIAPG